MSLRNEATLPASRPKSRKSISHPPQDNAFDKENMTDDIGALADTNKRSAMGDRLSKKLRSKSIGPGGLDALKDSTGNRRKSIAAPPPRSILKPSLPPLQEIPAHAASRKSSPKNPPQTPASTEVPSKSTTSTAANTLEVLPAPVQLEDNAAIAETRVLLRTEEEQQTAATAREEMQNQDSDDLAARRAARRKSLANRRVSFAPEATLHTWDVVEYMQDSTTSSASTNSTRRASSASAGTFGSPQPQTPGLTSPNQSDLPSTPPEQIEETITVSPAHQRDLHQKRRRRSSGIPPLNFNNPNDEDFSSSPSEASSLAGDVEEVLEDDNDADLNSESDEGTEMSIDVGEGADVSIASIKSAASSTGSSARLEEALQLAARQAGTQGIEFDERGGFGVSVEEEEEEEVFASFSPWSKNTNFQDFSPMQDQENMNPFSSAPRMGSKQLGESEENDELTMEITRAVGGILPEKEFDDGMSMDITRALGQIMTAQISDDEVTMDMTTAVGRILPEATNQTFNYRRKSIQNLRRQSLRRRSSGEMSSQGDETMDLTMAIGGIQQDGELPDDTEDEEMTMELTSVVGGVVESRNGLSHQRQQSTAKPGLTRIQETVGEANGDEAMDMTVAIGEIVSTAPDVFTASEAAEMNGRVNAVSQTLLPAQLETRGRPEARRLSEEPVGHSELGGSPFQVDLPPKFHQQPAVPIASETGSPSLAAFRGKGLRRSGGLRTSTTPKSTTDSSMTKSPARRPTTPSKQPTAKSSRSTTPAKKPPTGNEFLHTASPKRLPASAAVVQQLTPKVTPPINDSTPNKLFQRDGTGVATPAVVLNPHRRRSSGIGIDKAGLGSPRVAAILDRRRSIGDNATVFTAGKFVSDSRSLRFEDARAIQLEVDKARDDDKSREDGLKIMEREADVKDDKDATVNLKEMIQSLTPKKRPLKGRKSLHVGAGKGILGKRPKELDDDDEDDGEDQAGVKRLKNHQGSPVKNVKLQAPPTKDETTGRLTRAARRSLEAVSGNIVTPITNSSPGKTARITTPKGQGRFKDVEDQPSVSRGNVFDEKTPLEDDAETEVDSGDDRIQLQDFLNMTSIRFMELTTTKRRHTVAPSSLQTDSDQTNKNDRDNGTLESSVVAGACTVPMLELFQHSCHELKNYISEGRNMVREIETETFEENPPLFREYLSATPDIRSLMDNQFKNIKTHARLLSKAMWYEWRMKLLDGLKEGLLKIHEGMEADGNILQCHQELLDMVLPGLLKTHDQIALEEVELRHAAEELANCDQEELSEARQKLLSVEMDIETKKRMIDDLRNQLKDKENTFVTTSERKQAYLDEIREAEKIREECRGWTGHEISLLKAKVDRIEEQYGWTVTGVSGTITSLSFRGDLELVFDASSFKLNSTDEPPVQDGPSHLDLWYIAGNRERNPLPLNDEKSFFLESIRDGIRGMPQSQTTIKELLRAVSSGWEKALAVECDIQSLSSSCVTELRKTSDSSIAVCGTLLLIPLASKVEIQFNVTTSNSQAGLEIEVETSAEVIYGEKFNEKKMAEFLKNRVNSQSGAANERSSWTAAVEELEGRLLARGKR